MARGMKIEDMPVRFHFKGIDRVFDADNPKDIEDARAIVRSRPPVVIWVDEYGRLV